MKILKQFGPPVVGAITITAGLLWGMASLVDQGPPRHADVPSAAPPSLLTPSSPDPAPASLPVRRSAAPSNVVRSETRTYVLPSADATGDQEVATYNALQRNCYEAARNNQYGEYPALQQMACTRYAQFASQKGWDAGTLPAYGVPAPPATPAARVIEPAAPSQPSVNTCAALIAEKENINEHMRSGPGYGEPQGTRLRLRLHEIDDSLYALHCKLT